MTENFRDRNHGFQNDQKQGNAYTVAEFESNMNHKLDENGLPIYLDSYTLTFPDNIVPGYSLPSLPLTNETLALLDGASIYTFNGENDSDTIINPETDSRVVDCGAKIDKLNRELCTGPESGVRELSPSDRVYAASDSESTLFSVFTPTNPPEVVESWSNNGNVPAECNEGAGLVLSRITLIDEAKMMLGS